MVYGLNIVTPYDYNIGSEPLDGNLDEAARSVDRTPDGGAGLGGFRCGRSVKPELMPTKMRWQGGLRKIPDFDNSHCINVSEQAKAIFESFEPGVHQFIPVDYYNGKSQLLEKRYFMIPCNRIDSLDHERTTFVLKHYPHLSRWVPVADLVRWGEADLIPPHLPHDIQSKFVFNSAQIGRHHMWCDKFGPEGPWLSDEVAHAIRNAGLTGVNLNDDVSKAETA